MSERLFKSATSRAIGIGSMAGLALLFAAAPSRGADQVVPPPYQITGGKGVGVAVVWDEAAIRKALPPGITPVKAMTGGINIYSVERGYVIGPYSAAYFYVDIEGFDSPEGTKGRWMLAGVYGPQPKTSEALRASGLPVRMGTSRSEPTADGRRAIGIVNGHNFVEADIKPVPGSCEAAAMSLNYVSLSPQTEQIVVTKIPFVGDACKATLNSARITASPGDAFSAFHIVKTLGAGEFRNAAFTFTAPQPAGK